MTPVDMDALPAAALPSAPGCEAAAPERYQPGSGCEGADFMALFCDRCTRDAAFRNGTGDSCPIVADTMVFSTADEGYPKEWIYGPDDEPTCTAFDADTPTARPEEAK